MSDSRSGSDTEAPLTRSVCLSNFIIAFLQPSVRRSLMACVGQADGAELWGQDPGGPAHFSCPRLPVYCSHSSQDVVHAVPSALLSTATQCLPWEVFPSYSVTQPWLGVILPARPAPVLLTGRDGTVSVGPVSFWSPVITCHLDHCASRRKPSPSCCTHQL